MLQFNPDHPVLPFSPVFRGSMREPIDTLHCRLFLLGFHPPRDLSLSSGFSTSFIFCLKDSHNFFKLSFLLAVLSSLPGCLSDPFRLPLYFLSTLSRVLNILKILVQECTVKYPSQCHLVLMLNYSVWYLSLMKTEK